MPDKKIKVICINNTTSGSGGRLLKLGKEYTVDGQRVNPDDPNDTAYTLEEITQTCDCCGEKLCFDKEAFIPLN